MEKSDKTINPIGLNKSIAFTFVSAGIPILNFYSDIAYDVEVVARILDEYASTSEDDGAQSDTDPITLVDVNASPIDQELYEIQFEFFMGFASALRSVSRKDRDTLQSLPSDARVFLFLFR